MGVIDLNKGSVTKARVGEAMVALINTTMEKEAASKPPRYYLGASMVGDACPRRVQYQYMKTAPDEGEKITGKTYRIFDAGHWGEDYMACKLRAAGFVITTAIDGAQPGFEACGGEVQGHVDGIIVSSPIKGISVPALWEHKCLGNKSFSAVQKKGVALARPQYAAQIALYQAYMKLHKHAALFTALNRDTMDIYVELVSFNSSLAQQMSDRAVSIVENTRAGTMMPRIANYSDYYVCKWCQYSEQCWKEAL